MAAKHEDLRTNPTPTEATQQDAHLAGVPGTGTLRVMRGQNGSVMSLTGTWRLRWDDGQRDLDALLQAYREGRPVTYEGPVHDAQGEDRTERLEVNLSSVAEYAFDVDAPADDAQAAPRRTLFNFRPVGNGTDLR